MAYVITLAESIVHPALVTTSHILVTVLIVSRMIIGIAVVVARILFPRTLYVVIIITRATLLFLTAFCSFAAAVEVTLLSELLLIHLFIFLDVELPLIFRLFHS